MRSISLIAFACRLEGFKPLSLSLSESISTLASLAAFLAAAEAIKAAKSMFKFSSSASTVVPATEAAMLLM